MPMVDLGGLAGRSLPLAPVACTLDADDLGGREREWQALLTGALRAGRTIEGGVELRLHDAEGVADHARRLAEAERACCPWFATTITEQSIRGEREVVVRMVAADSTGAATLAAMFPITGSLHEPQDALHDRVQGHRGVDDQARRPA